MKETDTMLLFWKGWPAQWPKTPFVDYNGVNYVCAEQYMMAEKARVFGDHQTLSLIMAATSPKEQKELGRQVKNFDFDLWDKLNLDVVYRGNLFKFTQDDNLRSLLLNTGTRTLVEASPYDKVWGIGIGEEDPDALDPSKWKGENRLGIALMRVRNTINAFAKPMGHVSPS